MAKWIYKFVPAKQADLDTAGAESWEAVSSDGKQVLMKKIPPTQIHDVPK